MAKVSSRLKFLFLSLIFELMITQAVAQPTYAYHNCDGNMGNYTTNSTYRASLNHLLSILFSNTKNDYGFYNSSYGQNSDQVYAIGLCRGDIRPDDCRSCLNYSRKSITQRCPNQKAIEWYDECMLRYSYRSIFGIVATSPNVAMFNSQNITSNIEAFNDEVLKLFDKLRSQAVDGNSLRKYAAGNVLFAPNIQTIYALMQCTPELSKLECESCLGDALGGISQCCMGKRGARVLFPSCNITFVLYQFYESTDNNLSPLPPPPSSPPNSTTATTSKEKKANTSRTIVLVVVPTVAFFVLIISIFGYLRLKKANDRVETGPSFEEIASLESLQFDLVTIRVATNNFSEANKLGQGGFGPVYRGKLSNGQDIAVKMLSRDSGQGDHEFKNEVLIVAKLQHQNLVRLLGFCLQGSERLLVYEVVQNASLDQFIFDPIKHANLDWDRRYKIIGGIARGILYLHEDSRLRIIHRDLKASNILLDDEMNPKISDFVMARLFIVNQSQGNTSRIVGTYGYMAPEYAMHGHFSIESNVFSFGVLLLEMVSGQKNSCFRHGENVEDLLGYAWKNWNEDTISSLVDPSMRVGSGSDMMRCIHIALLCVQENAADRPTMNSVVVMLNNNSLTLPGPSHPAFFMHPSNRSDMFLDFKYSSAVIESDKSKSIPPDQASASATSMTGPYPR